MIVAVVDATNLRMNLRLVLELRRLGREDIMVICGGVIPGAPGNPDLEVVFFVFTTAADANDADGNGAPLVRETPPPVDNNGAPDVFLAAVDGAADPSTPSGPGSVRS